MIITLEGRCALVLGSTSGLGLATAEGLASAGARVAFTGRRRDLAGQAASRHTGALGIELDLTDPESIQHGVDAAEHAFGAVDIVVLNSGGPPPGQASELTASAIGAGLETLVMAQINVVSRLLPAMRERGWGRIVSIGSSGIDQPIPGLALSNAGRAALAGYLKTLSREVAADGVTVNMVLPGRIDTDRVTQLDQARARSTGQDVATVRAQSEQNIPVGRYGNPEEFANMAVFLCSDKAAYITGTRTRVDGGLVSGY